MNIAMKQQVGKDFQPMDKIDPVVYIVDDDVEVCESVAWLLESASIESTICHSAQELLDSFDDTKPACLILDVRMPSMSGIRLQEKLNELSPHVVVIFVSAHGDIRMSVDTIKAGAQDFLEKPYDSQRLLDAVQLGIESAERRFIEYSLAAEIRRKIALLTTREKEVLRLVVEGLPSQNIGRRLGMSVKTVDVHRTRIKSKTDADSVGTFVRDVLRFGVEI